MGNGERKTHERERERIGEIKSRRNTDKAEAGRGMEQKIDGERYE